MDKGIPPNIAALCITASGNSNGFPDYEQIHGVHLSSNYPNTTSGRRREGKERNGMGQNKVQILTMQVDDLFFLNAQKLKGKKNNRGKERGIEDEEEGECCCICLAELKDESAQAVIIYNKLTCGHMMHAGCLHEALANKAMQRCPICRFGPSTFMRLDQPYAEIRPFLKFFNDSSLLAPPRANRVSQRWFVHDKRQRKQFTTATHCIRLTNKDGSKTRAEVFRADLDAEGAESSFSLQSTSGERSFSSLPVNNNEGDGWGTFTQGSRTTRTNGSVVIKGTRVVPLFGQQQRRQGMEVSESIALVRHAFEQFSPSEIYHYERGESRSVCFVQLSLYSLPMGNDGNYEAAERLIKPAYDSGVIAVHNERAKYSSGFLECLQSTCSANAHKQHVGVVVATAWDARRRVAGFCAQAIPVVATTTLAARREVVLELSLPGAYPSFTGKRCNGSDEITSVIVSCGVDGNEYLTVIPATTLSDPSRRACVVFKNNNAFCSLKWTDVIPLGLAERCCLSVESDSDAWVEAIRLFFVFKNGSKQQQQEQQTMLMRGERQQGGRYYYAQKLHVLLLCGYRSVNNPERTPLFYKSLVESCALVGDTTNLLTVILDRNNTDVKVDHALLELVICRARNAWRVTKVLISCNGGGDCSFLHNRSDKRGIWPAHLAVKRHLPTLAKLLLKYGSIKDRDRDTNMSIISHTVQEFEDEAALAFLSGIFEIDCILFVQVCNSRYTPPRTGIEIISISEPPYLACIRRGLEKTRLWMKTIGVDTTITSSLNHTEEHYLTMYQSLNTPQPPAD
jgi:hypothetical protein